jgi:hypothetical protein
MQKGIGAFAGMIIGLILIVVAFLGPWYTLEGTGTFGAEYNVGFYLSRIEAKGSIAGQDIFFSTGYDQAKENAQMIGVNTQSFTVMETAGYLTLFAMATALIALIGMAAFVLRLGTPKIMKYIGGGFGLVTCLLALVPTVYTMTTGFSESSTGFWFSDQVLGVTITGGPGYAWYVMLLVAVITLISSVVLLFTKSPSEKVVTSPHEK